MTDEQFFETVDGLGFSSDTLKEGGLVSVSSSNLYAVGYSAASHTLIVGFLNGSAYQYQGVPKMEVIELLGAGSHGSYFHNNIRSSYPFQRL